MFKSYTATPTDIRQDWYVVDAEGLVLGRLATEIARIIRGKHKSIFTPHMDTGDGVIVINASKVRVTGRKAEQKEYFRHTGYMGHERFTPFATLLAKHPERIIEKAVYGMLPKIGRRKEAVCRVYLKPGSGKWDINGRTLGDYFPRPALVTAIQQPFTATDRLGQYDVKANVAGGGQTGQAGALRLAVARALVKIDEGHRRKLRDLGLLPRDARAVERKKPGRPKARKRFQFSKR